ncbi:N-acetylmuramoyl-L-alanine amidase isoform X1 [Alligator mississippiensis]|nr:N-acetylmuramoyl-L-alanine amidase isoform X1 [Alligator mississippiensis]
MQLPAPRKEKMSPAGPWILVTLLSACTWTTASEGSLPFHMDSVIHVLEAVEPDLGGHINLTVPDLARGLGCCDSDLEQLLLGAAPAMPLDLPSLTQERRAFLSSLLVPPAPALALASSVQHGVVLVPDGTTVALSPLLAGIDAGLKRRREMPLPPTALGSGPGVDLSHASSGPELPRTIDALYAVTIAKALGLAFLLTRHNKSKAAMGPDGCWDNVAEPQNFTLLGSPSALPDAIINGALDGVVLGAWLAERTEPPAPVSTLLREYYAAGDLTGPGQARSNFRRQNFAALSPTKALTGQVASALLLLQTLPQTQALFQGVGTEELLGLAHKAAQEFTVTYLECPAIIPRCMWEARPYKGEPQQLHLPLGFLYIHHTYIPSQPCRSFPECAANMRAMQRFHQDDHGWNDIGYNFVVGSDGYLYQGRGWHWVGAHTRGYNNKGYGVSYIGDYSTTLPEPFTLALVRNRFLRCAVAGARLQANYTVHGHRQMGHTKCPGDALFQEIETWHGFK